MKYALAVLITYPIILLYLEWLIHHTQPLAKTNVTTKYFAMLVHTMTIEEIIDEVNHDLYDIAFKVIASAREKGGKIKIVRSIFKRNLSPLKRNKIYIKTDLEHRTKKRNHWKCIVHIFNKLEIWQGYTSIKGSNNIKTVFYEWDKIFFIDTHFFSRYRERYLNHNNIDAESAVEYFNKNNDVFSTIPTYLDELELNQVMVLLKHGVGLGEKIEYTANKTAYNMPRNLSAKNFRINTFIGFNDLKKSQLEDIIIYLQELQKVIKSNKQPDIDPFDFAMLRLKYEQIMSVAPIIIKMYEPYH